MKKVGKQLWCDEEGQDLTEYALLLALIALFVVASINTLATAISTTFANAVSNLSTT